MVQQSLSDMEYSQRKRVTRREEFLDIMDEIIPWEEWVSLIVPHYPSGKRGRPPVGMEIMLRMYLLQCWFHVSKNGINFFCHIFLLISTTTDQTQHTDQC